MEIYTGEIVGSGANLQIKEANGNTSSYVNGAIVGERPGDKFEFIKIIQGTPNGDRVTAILKTKLP